VLIIPTYNERENIAPLVTRIRQSAPNEQILFADDSSPDGTAEEIRHVQELFSGVHLMLRSKRDGYGAACRAAMRRVLEENLDDHVIQFDADLSHPPECLPRMLDLLKTNDVVIGSRYVRGGGSRNWSLSRKALSFGANFYARALTGVPVHDVTAGFVGYRAAILKRIDLDRIRSNGYAFLMEMKFALRREGATFAEFPIVFVEREAGTSKFNRRIMMEGVRFPLKALVRRLSK
jgi:dolichol-phosphate mannosyltransferase